MQFVYDTCNIRLSAAALRIEIVPNLRYFFPSSLKLPLVILYDLTFYPKHIAICALRCLLTGTLLQVSIERPLEDFS